MIAKSIIAGIVSFLTVVGCYYMYQRETNILTTQAALIQYANQNEVWKKDVVDAVNKLSSKLK